MEGGITIGKQMRLLGSAVDTVLEWFDTSHEIILTPSQVSQPRSVCDRFRICGGVCDCHQFLYFLM
jgi:hypothetical protein